MNTVEIPNDISQHAQNAFNRITEKLRNAPQPPQGGDFAHRERVRRLREEWNAPERHLKRNELHGEKWLAKLEEAKAKLGSGFTLGFVGKRGPGKTQMAVELMRHQTGVRVESARYATAMEIFMSLRATYGERAARDEAEAVASWVKPRLLVIDEVQERGESAWEDRMLTEILNRRYNFERDTILISNLSKEEMLASIGPSIAHRLKETGGIVHFEWESYR